MFKRQVHAVPTACPHSGGNTKRWGPRHLSFLLEGTGSIPLSFEKVWGAVPLLDICCPAFSTEPHVGTCFHTLGSVSWSTPPCYQIPYKLGYACP